MSRHISWPDQTGLRASDKVGLSIAAESSQGRRRGQGSAGKAQKTTTSAPTGRWSW